MAEDVVSDEFENNLIDDTLTLIDNTLVTSSSSVTVEGIDNVIVIIVETTTAEPTKKPTNVLAGTTGTDLLS